MNRLNDVRQIMNFKKDFLYEKAAGHWINMEKLVQDTDILKNAIISLYADYDNDCNCDPLLWFCIGYGSSNSEGACNGENCCGCICCGTVLCLMCNH